jgi:hypothetical protein
MMKFIVNTNQNMTYENNIIQNNGYSTESPNLTSHHLMFVWKKGIKNIDGV